METTLRIGQYNELRMVKNVDFGVYLDGGESGEILLPNAYVPDPCRVGDMVKVFIYKDSEDRLIATTQTPYAKVGDFACLEVVSLNHVGAFLNWGLLKDLFVPFREQKAQMQVGQKYVVYVYLDEQTDRIVASAKIEKFIDKSMPPYDNGEKVKVLICQPTDLGFKAIIDNRYMGMLYKNELHQELSIGMQLDAYIKTVRDDDKIDLLLYKGGQHNYKDGSTAQLILEKLDQAGGFLEVTDKSPAEVIYKLFGISKKSYKMGVGELYKKRIIALEENGIRKIEL